MAFDPSTLDATDIALILAAVSLGGLVKGIIGLGLPLIAIPILSGIVDPRTAVAILTLPMIASNLIQARTGGNPLDTALQFRWLLIPMVICSFVGTMIITTVPVHYAKGLVGFIVFIFALLTLSGKQPVIPTGADKFVRPLIGAFGGIIGGMTSFFGPPIIPYLISLNLEKSRFVQVMGMAFMLSAIPLLVGMILKGFAPPAVLLLSALASAAIFLAMFLGGVLREHVPQALFMKLVAGMLLIIGGKMVWTIFA